MAEDFQSDDDFKRWLEQLRKAVDAALAGDQSIIGALLKSLLSSFLGLNTDDRDAPDFEDISDPAERARLERDYSQNREAGERRKYGDYRQSVGQWSAESLEKSAAKLAALRADEEAKNGDKALEYAAPVAGGRVTSEFGHREASATGGVGSTEHKGLDIGPPVRGEKVPVRAPMTGVVVGKGWRGGYGNMVEIVDIYGVHHRFGHLDSASINVGDTVRRGQPFAVMGTTGHSTGIHLHYEQRDGDGTPRAPQLAEKIWREGQTLPEAAAAPQLAANTPAPSAAHHAARVAVQPIKAKIVAVVEHPKSQPHETGLSQALHQAQAVAAHALHGAKSLLGLG